MIKRLALILLLCAAPAWATTYTVASDAEMLAAISTLGVGDNIVIDNSWSSSTGYIITPASVDIYSTSPTNTITLGADNTYVFLLNGNSIKVRGFTINGNKAARTTGTGIGLAGTSDNVSGMVIDNCFNYGVLVFGSKTGHTITGSTITNTGGTGINKNTYGNAIRLNSNSSATVTWNTLSNDSTGGPVFFGNAAKNYVLSFNTITGGTDGIRLYTGSDNVTVQSNTITNWAVSTAGDGVAIAATNSLIDNNAITQAVDTAYAAWGFEIYGGSAAADNTIISGNRIGGANLDRGFSGGGSLVTIRRNVITSISGNILQNCSGSSFYYNAVTTTGTDNSAMQFDSSAAGARTIDVYNNTLYDSGTTTSGVNFKETAGTWSAINFKNNITFGFDNAVVVDDKDNDNVAITHTNNSYFGSTKNLQKNVLYTYTDITLDATEITADPLLLSATDFRLSITSPAINAGASVGLTTDLLGNGMNGSPDIGAYELGTVSTPLSFTGSIQ